MIKVIHCPMLNSQELKQYRFPKTKKKRIRAKWAKRTYNFRYEDKYVCIHNKETREILVSTNVYEKYKAALGKTKTLAIKNC